MISLLLLLLLLMKCLLVLVVVLLPWERGSDTGGAGGAEAGGWGLYNNQSL